MFSKEAKRSQRRSWGLGPRHVGTRITILSLVLMAALSLPPFAAAEMPTVVDLAVESKFQDSFFGHFKRGRTSLAVDFDLDGWIDFFLGNPGDESMVIRNLGPSGNGFVEFEAGQILLVGEKAYGAASADYDNDGDYDIFVTNGGIEGVGRCALFKNLFLETGALNFEDVTDAAGVRGAVPKGESQPVEDHHADCNWADFDRDGDVDIFVSVYSYGDSLLGHVHFRGSDGRNILWSNDGDGTFTDMTNAVGLGATLRPTLHSAVLDFDNDGDMDLYENNYVDHNVLWKNEIEETGVLNFVDVTAEMSPPGEDISYPLHSFVSAAVDFNNDGWQDIISFTRENDAESPYGPGRLIFINQAGTGFINEADAMGINNPHISVLGVMGCQVGDVNGDGVMDVFIGNGGVPAGNYSQLFVSDAAVSPPGSLPTLVNISEVIDFPAPEDGTSDYPVYPYRNHGTCFVDLDNDGDLEITQVNGGHSDWPDIVREPNRLFVFDWPTPFNYLKVRAIGDAVQVSRDAVGTRFALTLSEGAGKPWTIHNTVLAGSAFSAQQGFEVWFGLAQADTIHSLTLTWPNGKIETLTDGLNVNTSLVVQYTVEPCPGDANQDGIVDPLDSGFVLARLGCSVGAGDEACDAADVNDDAVVDPLDVGAILARFGVCE